MEEVVGSNPPGPPKHFIDLPFLRRQNLVAGVQPESRMDSTTHARCIGQLCSSLPKRSPAAKTFPVRSRGTHPSVFAWGSRGPGFKSRRPDQTFQTFAAFNVLVICQCAAEVIQCMRAIGYARVSTDNQADRGVSLYAQTERIRLWWWCTVAELDHRRGTGPQRTGRADGNLQTAPMRDHLAEDCCDAELPNASDPSRFRPAPLNMWQESSNRAT